MKVKELMVPSVRACFANEDLAKAARLMWEHDCGCVPVLSDQARVIGMITDRDICMAVFFHCVPMSEIRVSEAMSRQLFVCSADDELASAETIMNDKKVRRLPVLNTEGRMVGLISFSDIAERADQEHTERATPRRVTDAQVARLAAAISRSQRTAGRPTRRPND